MTTISVLITTYGTDDWRDLAHSRALPSVLEQGADEVLVEHWPDLAIGPARNATAAKATGFWLLQLDADDELAPGYVDAMRTAIRRPSVSSLALFQPAVSYVRKQAAPPLLMPTKDLRTDNYLVIGTVVSRNLFNMVSGFNDLPHGFEDWSLWAKCWKMGGVVHPVPEAVYRAHINPQSAHRTMWRNRKEQVAMHLKVQAELFPDGVG